MLTAVAVAVGVVTAFAAAGVPLSWLLDVRVAAIANVIGRGVSSLPEILVPYTGLDPAVRLVIVLGAGVLLLDAALLLALAPPVLEDLRRAGPQGQRRQRGVPEGLFERPAGGGDGLGVAALLAAQQGGVIILDRQDTARLAGRDRPA